MGALGKAAQAITRPKPRRATKPAIGPTWEEKKVESGWRAVDFQPLNERAYGMVSPTCACEDCRRRRSLVMFPPAVVQAEDMEGRSYRIEPSGTQGAIFVNGHIVQPYWEGDGTDRVSDEVLERAVRLAIAAHPETMRNFVCGTQLRPGAL